MVASFLEWEIQGIEPSVQYGGSASRLWGLLGQSWSSCQRQGGSQPDTGKILIRKTKQDQLAVHCTLLCCDGSNGVSPLHLASIWFLPKLLREVIPSRSSQSQFCVLKCLTFDCSWDHRSLYSGIIILVSLPPCFPCLCLICHSLFLLSFYLLPEQVAEWRAFCCFPVGCFFKLRGFEFDEWKWNESANTHVTDWTLCVKGKWMLVIHLGAISLTQSQTRADSTGIFGSSLGSGKGTGTGRDFSGKFTGVWAGSSSDQWKSLPFLSILTGACEMHVKNFVKYFSKINQFIDDKRHSEVKRLLPLAFQPNMFRNKIRELRDITVLLSGQEPLSSRSFCIWK